MRRLLPHDEWHKLREPVKHCFGDDKEPPSPDIAPFCAVEEDEEGNIKGFLFLQLAFHLEPFGSIDHASFSGLRKVIDDTLTNLPNAVYYIYSDNPTGIDKFKSEGFYPLGILFAGQPRPY